MNFEKLNVFLEDFEKINSFSRELSIDNPPDCFYIPKDPSPNYFRHFGRRVNGKLFLEYREVLYIFFKNLKTDGVKNFEIKQQNLEIQAYFELKKNEINLLWENNKQMVYKKTKHFNREKELNFATLNFVDGNEEVLEYFLKLEKNEILGIKGKNDFCLMEVKRIEFLDNKLSKKMRK